MNRCVARTANLVVLLLTFPSSGLGAIVFGLDGGGSLDGGARWNAANTSFSTSAGTLERSLVGGLRYSIAGGSYEAYRDMFMWGSQPTVADFQNAVQQSFAAWTVVDPASGFGTQLAFVEDFGTTVNSAVEGNVRLGAEIDLFAADFGTGSGLQGDAFFNAATIGGGITLTSGTTGYGGFAITGADIRINNRSGVLWTLDIFQVLLTHEIGHAIGLGDVERASEFGFIDDNYSAADPLNTLTNSWAHLVNALDPGDSTGLSLYNVPNDANGIDAVGVDILMESAIPGIFVTNGASLQNDDFGGRQFLYPELTAIPEVSAFALMGVVSLGLIGYRAFRTLGKMPSDAPKGGNVSDPPQGLGL